MLDNTVYVGTLDGYLVALDARVGTERWTVHVGENPTGHSITAAPLVVDDKVIVGISGGEAGIRGFLDAYDAKTGKQLWRFWTVPSPGRAGQRHRGPATAGCTAAARRGSPDRTIRQLKLLYWGTGNPGPDWNGDSRIGDNLYTSSLVAHRRRDRQGALVIPVHAARRRTTGTPTRFRCSSTPSSAAGRARSW